MRILILGVLFLFGTLGNVVFAAYPEQAIRVIVPYKAGGAQTQLLEAL